MGSELKDSYWYKAYRKMDLELSESWWCKNYKKGPIDSKLLESWWEKDYKKYSIATKSSSLFVKFNAIRSSYAMILENIYEVSGDTYKILNGSKVNYSKWIEWHDTNPLVYPQNFYASPPNVKLLKFKGQSLEHIFEDDSYYYEHWNYRKNARGEKTGDKVYESSRINDRVERGMVHIAYQTHDERIFWKVEKAGRDGDISSNKYPCYDLNYIGSRDSEKGTTEFIETLEITPINHIKVGNYFRNSKYVHKEEHKNLMTGEITVKIISSNGDSYKRIGINIINGIEKGAIEIKKRNTLTVKKWESCAKYIYEEILIITNKISGKITYQEGQESYMANWLVNDKSVIGKMNVVCGNKTWDKNLKYNAQGSYEIMDFKLDSAIWGIIRERTSQSYYKIEWTNKKPEMHNIVENKVDLRGTISNEPESQIKLDKEKMTIDIREEIQFMFESLKTLKIYEYPVFVPKINNNFKIQVEYPGDTLEKIIDDVFSLLNSNSKSALSMLEYQSVSDFGTILGLIQQKKTVNLDLDHLSLELKNIIMLISNIARSDSNSCDFYLPSNKREEFHALKLKFSRHYFLKKQLEGFLEQIQNASESKLEYIDFNEENSELVDDEYHHTICFNCNTICHEDCSLDYTQIHNMGDNMFKSCASMDEVKKSCKVCEGKCPYKVHYHTKKRIYRNTIRKTIEANEYKIKANIELQELEMRQAATQIMSLSSIIYLDFEIDRQINIISNRVSNSFNSSEKIDNEVKVLKELKDYLV
jgi:hypothetical protein